MAFEYSVSIAAPVERVFRFVSDPGNWGDFGAAAVIHDVRLSPHGLGTTYRWTGKVGPIRLEGRNEFTEFVPNERITDESSSSFEGTWTYLFAPENGGTRVTIRNVQRSFWRIQPLGALMDFLASGHKEFLHRLKATIEERP